MKIQKKNQKRLSDFDKNQLLDFTKNLVRPTHTMGASYEMGGGKFWYYSNIALNSDLVSLLLKYKIFDSVKDDPFKPLHNFEFEILDCKLRHRYPYVLHFDYKGPIDLGFQNFAKEYESHIAILIKAIEPFIEKNK